MQKKMKDEINKIDEELANILNQKLQAYKDERDSKKKKKRNCSERKKIKRCIS